MTAHTCCPKCRSGYTGSPLKDMKPPQPEKEWWEEEGTRDFFYQFFEQCHEGLKCEGCAADMDAVIAKIRSIAAQSEKKGREAERSVCRQIFIDEVDWSEWGVSDEQAGEDFDAARSSEEGKTNNK